MGRQSRTLSFSWPSDSVLSESHFSWQRIARKRSIVSQRNHTSCSRNAIASWILRSQPVGRALGPLAENRCVSWRSATMAAAGGDHAADNHGGRRPGRSRPSFAISPPTCQLACCKAWRMCARSAPSSVVSRDEGSVVQNPFAPITLLKYPKKTCRKQSGRSLGSYPELVPPEPSDTLDGDCRSSCFCRRRGRQASAKCVRSVSLPVGLETLTATR
jgi:hypothetical protein